MASSMERFDKLKVLEKYALFIDFISRNIHDTDSSVNFYPPFTRMEFSEHSTNNNTDRFTRESALSYISETILDDFGKCPKENQVKFADCFLKKYDRQHVLYYCHGCGCARLDDWFSEGYIGCIIEGCKVQYCKGCYKKFPAERRGRYKIKIFDKVFEDECVDVCHIHKTLYDVLWNHIEKLQFTD